MDFGTFVFAPETVNAVAFGGFVLGLGIGAVTIVLAAIRGR